jgi:glycosyltransferase involved in cell wall biosynthesis
MHILYFHQHFSTPSGSTGVRSYQMATLLVQRGHTVSMVCGSYDMADTGLSGAFKMGRRTGVVDGIKVIEFDLPYSNKDGFIRRLSTFVAFAYRSMKLLFHTSPDLIVASSTPITVGIPALVGFFLRRTPIVFELRDIWLGTPSNARSSELRLSSGMRFVQSWLVIHVMRAIENLCARRAIAVIALSSGIVDELVRRGIPLNKIALIPNGSDLDLFPVRGGQSDRFPALSLDRVQVEPLVAVYAGTHGHTNNLTYVLEAAQILKERDARVRFVLIGDGANKAALMEMAVERKLDNVVFHDPVRKDQLANSLLSADVGLQILANVPSFHYCTSPNKFFDYLAAGLPIIVNYPGWVADLIDEQQLGYEVSAHDPMTLATILENAANDSSQLKQMALRSRQIAETRFDRRIMASEFVRCVELAAARPQNEGGVRARSLNRL